MTSFVPNMGGGGGLSIFPLGLWASDEPSSRCLTGKSSQEAVLGIGNFMSFLKFVGSDEHALALPFLS